VRLARAGTCNFHWENDLVDLPTVDHPGKFHEVSRKGFSCLKMKNTDFQSIKQAMGIEQC
jgi:hypothetical protein